MDANNAGGSSGNGPTATGAASSSGIDSGNVEALINGIVNKALGARMARFEEKLTETIQSSLGKLAPAAAPSKETESQTQSQDPAGNVAGAERLTLKTLQSTVDQLTKQLQQQQKATQEAESRAKSVRLRGEVESQLARAIGADNPHLGAYMSTLFDVQKRFGEDAEGRPVMKFRRDWGDETKTLDEGFGELLSGELKHLVPSKAPSLPPGGFSPYLRGGPVSQQGGRPGAPGPALAMNPLQAELLEGLAKDRPDLANSYAHAVQTAAVQSAATRK